MKLGALCFLSIFLAGCAIEDPPTGPERAVLNSALLEEHACELTPDGRGVQLCSMLLVMDDNSLARLAEIRHGIPYVEPAYDKAPVRYALWLGRATLRGQHVREHIGPLEESYRPLLDDFMEQPVTG